MKKILVLGGAKAQVKLIAAAKKEGYCVVLCDFTDTNPGIAMCDVHYKVNYMNFDEVLDIAKKEKVDGVVSNSEYAMPTVSYVCDALHCTGNSSKSLSLLNDKYNFRKLQKSLDLYAPNSFESSQWEECFDKIQELKFPVVIKPAQSSGSRGTTVINDIDEFRNAKQYWDACSKFSRNNKVVVEEFVKPHDLDAFIGGDIFVIGEAIFYCGLFSSKRSKWRPLIPMTQTYPIIIDKQHFERLKDEVDKIIKQAGITFGELNIEGYFTNDDNLFFIEFNARQGGNGIPEVILRHSGVDFTKLLVTSAVGDMYYFEKIMHEKIDCRFVSRHPLFWTGDKYSGCYKGVGCSDEIKPFIAEISEIEDKNMLIHPAQNASDCLAFIDLEFTSREQQIEFVSDIESHIWPIVE